MAGLPSIKDVVVSGIADLNKKLMKTSDDEGCVMGVYDKWSQHETMGDYVSISKLALHHKQTKEPLGKRELMQAAHKDLVAQTNILVLELFNTARVFGEIKKIKEIKCWIKSTPVFLENLMGIFHAVTAFNKADTQNNVLVDEPELMETAQKIENLWMAVNTVSLKRHSTVRDMQEACVLQGLFDGGFKIPIHAGCFDEQQSKDDALKLWDKSVGAAFDAELLSMLLCVLGDSNDLAHALLLQDKMGFGQDLGMTSGLTEADKLFIGSVHHQIVVV